MMMMMMMMMIPTRSVSMGAEFTKPATIRRAPPRILFARKALDLSPVLLPLRVACGAGFRKGGDICKACGCTTRENPRFPTKPVEEVNNSTQCTAIQTSLVEPLENAQPAANLPTAKPCCGCLDVSLASYETFHVGIMRECCKGRAIGSIRDGTDSSIGEARSRGNWSRVSCGTQAGKHHL
eukprot:1666355-Amphidinium_carterae.1